MGDDIFNRRETFGREKHLGEKNIWGRKTFGDERFN